MELAIVDLESHADEAFGRLTAASVEAGTGLKADVFGIRDDLAGLLDAKRIFVTGSADMLAEADWAPQVATSVAVAVQTGIPTLAVCFGHQMMARHYGGQIRSFDTIRKGVEPVMFHGGGPFPPGLVRLIHTHRDYVVSPGKMRPVGSGGFGGIAALQHPEWPLWSCQGHPEWNAALCDLDGHRAWQAYDETTLDTSGLDILRRFAQ